MVIHQRVHKHVPEHAVQHHVEIGARDRLPLVPVQAQDVGGIVGQRLAVRGEGQALHSQRLELIERRVQKAQIHQQRVAAQPQHVERQFISF